MDLDFKQIAVAARAFYDVGLIRLDEPWKDRAGVQIIPFNVNTALACELFMKAIIIYENPQMRSEQSKKLGHCLDNLFKTMSLEAQNKIRDQIPEAKIQEMQKQTIAAYQDFLRQNLSDNERKVGEHAANSISLTFDEMLKDHSKVFQEWRYYFEATDSAPIMCDEWFLYEFCMVLYNHVAEIMNQK